MKQLLVIAIAIFGILFSSCSNHEEGGISLIPSSLDPISAQSESDASESVSSDHEIDHSSGTSSESPSSSSSEISSSSSRTQQPAKETSQTSSVESRPSEKPSTSDTDSSAPTPPQSSESSSSTIPPVEKDIYAYPFDIEAIKTDLIRYGVEELKMTHRLTEPDGTVRTPDNCAWRACYPLTPNCTNPDLTRRQLYEMVKYDKEEFNLKNFTIYIKPNGTNRYLIYMLY